MKFIKNWNEFVKESIDIEKSQEISKKRDEINQKISKIEKDVKPLDNLETDVIDVNLKSEGSNIKELK